MKRCVLWVFTLAAIGASVCFAGPKETATTLPADYDGPWPWETSLLFELESGDVVSRVDIGDVGQFDFPQFDDEHVADKPSPPGVHLRVSSILNDSTAVFAIYSWDGELELRTFGGNRVPTGRLTGPWSLKYQHQIIITGIDASTLVDNKVYPTADKYYRCVKPMRVSVGERGAMRNLQTFAPLDVRPYRAAFEEFERHSTRVKEEIAKAKRDRLDEISKAVTAKVVLVRRGPPHASLDEFAITVTNGSDFAIAGTSIDIKGIKGCDKTIRIYVGATKAGESRKSKAFAWPKGCKPRVKKTTIRLNKSSYDGLPVP